MFGKNNKQIQFFCTLFFDFHSWSMVLYLPSVMPKVWLSRLRMSCLCSNFSGLVELLEPLQHWLAHFEKYINYLIFGYGSMQPLKILWPPSVYSCRDGAVVRALASHQCGSGWFPDPGSNVGWVCWFSSLHREVFSGYSGFPSSQKPKFDLIVLIVNLVYSVPN